MHFERSKSTLENLKRVFPVYLRGNRRWPGALVMSGGTLQWTECSSLSIVSLMRDNPTPKDVCGEAIVSLHNRRFISQARWTRHFQKKTCETCPKREKREEKNKALVTSPLLWLSGHPTPTSIDWRRWYQKHQSKHDPLHENCRLSGYRKHRQQHNYKPQEITARTKTQWGKSKICSVKV